MAWVLVFSSANFAVADASPSPSSTPEIKILMNQYKLAMDKYRVLIKNRDEVRTQINRTFIVAVESANREARMSMRLAITASEKTDVIVKQKTAIASASDARDAAIAALGILPTPPVKPVKQGEVAPTNKMKSQKPSPTSTRKSKN
ncbi:unannotated protein [freshwater metagenome]|uniref:Unannotated protein n=1 Tax=freshwater metagenome TaxID=449393 RepID=A0A6J5YPP2_9ZZZZ